MITAERKAKLKWECRRGMLELDLFLTRFIAKELDSLTEKQMEQLEKLLSCSDPDIFSWLMGSEQPNDKDLKTIVDFIQDRHQPG